MQTERAGHSFESPNPLGGGRTTCRNKKYEHNRYVILHFWQIISFKRFIVILTSVYLSRYSEVCQAKIALFIICASFVQVYHRQAMLYALTCLRASVTPQYQYSTPTAVWTRRVEGCLCSTVHAEMVA